jgi:hypothetical protein
VTVTVGPAIDTRKFIDEMNADTLAVARRLREVTREYILTNCGEPDLGDEGV